MRNEISECPTVVVVWLGKPMSWLRGRDEVFRFWKDKARTTVFDPVEHPQLLGAYEYPGGYDFYVSLWETPTFEKILVFEADH